MKKGPYEVLSSEVKYKNPWITVTEEKVIKPDGKEGVFGIVDYGSGVSVVAINKSKEIYLIREYCYSLEEYGIQLPAGAIDNNEEPLTAAKRELAEETGIISNNWIDLGISNPLTMILKSPAYLFLALNTDEVGRPEAGIEVIKKPFDEAVEMVLRSEITHAGSCNAILRASFYLKRNNL